MKLDVCIVTHNPPRTVFELTLRAIARQTLPRDEFEVWIIDNASTPPLAETDFAPLREAGLPFRLIRENRLGNCFGRACAIASTSSDWLVFVDDDNELSDDYLATVKQIIHEKPRLGCFGGRMLLPPHYRVPNHAKSVVKFLAIKDCGNQPLTNCVDCWGEWEPPTAGAAVRRPVLELFSQRIRQMRGSGQLGRRGRNGLMSGEDSLMMRGAYKLGLHCSYEPRLHFVHHIDPHRFGFWYLLRLLYCYGRSHVVLERCLGHEVKPQTLKEGWKLLTNFPRRYERLFRLAWRWGYFFESRDAGAASPVADSATTAVPAGSAPSAAVEPHHRMA